MTCDLCFVPAEYQIGLAIYTQVDKFEIKTPWFGHVSREILNPEFKVGTLNPNLLNKDSFLM